MVLTIALYIKECNMQIFDSHAHYNDEKFELDREETLKKVYDSGVKNLICAGYSVESSKQAIKIANEHNYIYATAGVSPNDIPIFENENTDVKEFFFEDILNEQLKEIKKLAKSKKVVAIGEIGLDYYWNKENKRNQKSAFIKQIEIANELNLPIVIHTREAIADTIDILKKYTVINKGVFHCCPLNIDLIREALKLGFYISFAGPITFKNSKNATEAIASVPLEKILIETDSPYLAPEPKRGTRNDSSNLIYMIKKIAEVKQISEEEIAEITYKNARDIFKINPN